MNLLQLTAKLILDTTAYEKGISSAKSELEKLGDASIGLGEKISSIGNVISDVGVAFVGLSTTSTKALSDMISLTMEAERGISKMSTIFDTSQHSIKDTQSQFLDLSAQLGISVTDLEEAGYQALSAGQSYEQLGEFVKVAGKLSVAGFTDTTTATDLLTTALNTYKDANMDVNQVANIFLKTQNDGKTVISELNNSIGRVIPTAGALHVSFEDLNAGFIQLTKNGMRTRYAATYLSSMISELGDEGSEVAGVLTEKTGMSFTQLMDNGYSLADVLDILGNSVDGDTTQLINMFSRMEAGKAAASLFQNGTDSLRGSLQALQQAGADTGTENDLLEQGFQKMQDSMYSVKRIVTNLTDSAIVMGGALLEKLSPYIDMVVKKTEELYIWVSNADNRTKLIVPTILAIGSALSPVLILIGKAISLVGSGISGLSGIVGGVAKDITSLFSGVGTVAGDAAEAIIMGGEAVTESGSIMASVFNAVKGVLSSFGEGIINVCKWLVDFGVQAFNFVKNFDLMGSATSLVKGIIEGFQGSITMLSSAFEFILSPISLFIESVAKMGIVETINFLFGEFFTMLSGAASTVFSPVAIAIGVLVAVFMTIKDKGEEMVETLMPLWETLKETATTVFNSISEIVKQYFVPAFNEVKNVVEMVKGVFGEVMPYIEEIVMFVFTYICAFADSLLQTFNKVFPWIAELVKTAFDVISAAYHNIIVPVFQLLMTIVGTVWDVFKIAFPAIENIVGIVFNAILGLWNNILSPCFEALMVALNLLASAFSVAFEAISFIVGAVISGIQLLFDGFRITIDIVATAISGFVIVVSSIFESLLKTAQNVWDGICNAITEPMETAKETVKKIIDKIRGFFDFKFEWPHLPVPHIVMSPDNWQMSDLLLGKIPSFDINWNAKAMNTGMILNGATIFGMSGDKLLGGGEQGSEMVIGTNTLMGMIKDASSEGLSYLANILNAILRKLDELDIKVDVEVDKREFARLVKQNG